MCFISVASLELLTTLSPLLSASLRLLPTASRNVRWQQCRQCTSPQWPFLCVAKGQLSFVLFSFFARSYFFPVRFCTQTRFSPNLLEPLQGTDEATQSETAATQDSKDEEVFYFFNLVSFQSRDSARNQKPNRTSMTVRQRVRTLSVKPQPTVNSVGF